MIRRSRVHTCQGPSYHAHQLLPNAILPYPARRYSSLLANIMRSQTHERTTAGPIQSVRFVPGTP